MKVKGHVCRCVGEVIRPFQSSFSHLTNERSMALIRKNLVFTVMKQNRENTGFCYRSSRDLVQITLEGSNASIEEEGTPNLSDIL